MNVMERFYDKGACSFGDVISHNGTGALNLTKTISSSWPGPRSPFHFFSKGETPPSVPFAGKWYLVAAHCRGRIRDPSRAGSHDRPIIRSYCRLFRSKGDDLLALDLFPCRQEFRVLGQRGAAP
jgi:hypothetical protein